ncbi:serine hydrolase domain-containing protein [Mycobacterium helveticum]|uniref:Beta-lactamase family protein n=1 Tax=Mycobacterium helveticum TaxID=2592811 RepID=A0A557XGF3_9MYCO|nr:serine hydrolase domain-containing protein [Mycobacterium helveticum]TVS82962.1 beta-lactamase family protein [Mycobacterium helveticum]TVS84721.1 beta-lactamase family protein [Mycobacterium helveticum]
MSLRTAVAIGTVLLALVAVSSRRPTTHPAPGEGARVTPLPAAAATPDLPVRFGPLDPAAGRRFAAVSALVSDAVAAGRLPGAVVAIGHGGKVVFHRAYGVRKLAGEPGLDGSPAPAEPMTEDTVFDMSSLTKCLATATAVMQLYEQGRVRLDDPVQTHLPGFNPANDPQRAKVTVRMLLTHTSGEPGDVDLADPWGLDRPDKAEGVRRALTTPLQSGPGTGFRYSDVNFVLLGALIEKVTGDAEDVYVAQHVFAPLDMKDSRYLPAAKACGPRTISGAAVGWSAPAGRAPAACPAGTWRTSLLPRIAPTARDEESAGDPARNPDYGNLLRGTVDDPTARRMGGVAGHAGVFSTAHDLSVYAQALLDRLAGRPSRFALTTATLALMTRPEQPGQLPGHGLRGIGWDIDTAYSGPRGLVFPVGSFGHTGFTGTSLWMDPGSDTYVLLLSNAIHVRGSPPTTSLDGEVATAAARALHLYGSAPSAGSE